MSHYTEKARTKRASTVSTMLIDSGGANLHESPVGTIRVNK